MSTPPITLVRQYDTHRLIPSKYADKGDSILTRIAEDDAHLRVIFDLDHATNDRLLAENNLLPGIQIDELIFGVPYYRIVNAAFCHAHPYGSRFNGPDRGAWYAAFELETAQAEVVFHKTIQLAEVNWFDEVVTYDNYLADFSADMHDLRDNSAFEIYLNPASYTASQKLAEDLFGNDGLGIVYPSVRHPGGTCVACFRPTLIANVRKVQTFEFAWTGPAAPKIRLIS